MNTWINCSIESILYHKNSDISNPPINLSLCISFHKDKYSWYPDTEGKPSIKFIFSDKHAIDWVYPNLEIRERDYNKIIKMIEKL